MQDIINEKINEVYETIDNMLYEYQNMNDISDYDKLKMGKLLAILSILNSMK